MMIEIFDYPLVKKMDKKIKDIDPNLSITKVGHLEDKVTSMGLRLPLKGNAETIDKLKRIGFEKEYKEKQNGVFYQRMVYPVYYDKYAIYQGTVGKYALDYVDNVYDFRRQGHFGNPYDIEFPIVVNRNGGRHTFDKKFEEGFLEIREVLEDEEPLTREEMFPKNSEKFKYGWIDREGNTYACSFENHSLSAEYICKDLGIKSYNEERTLEELGWIKISRKVPYTYETMDSQTIYFDWNKDATQAQIDTLFDLGLDKTEHFNLLLRHMDDDYER